MSASASSVFSGTSTFSSDFAQVVTRAQNIASLPITLLTSQKATITAEQKALGGLSDSFTSLQTALQSIDSTLSSGTYDVSYSDKTVASATPASGALPGNYTLQVVDPGSQATANSTASVADPTTTSISSATTFSLTANDLTFVNIKPASNTLSSLADAINTATGGAVQATIVNFGTTNAPRYQLSIQNTRYGNVPITLNESGGTNLLATPTGGAAVQYRVNGQPADTTLTSDSRVLTIAPNVTATALAQGTTVIRVASSTTGVSNQIAAFVSAYNATVTSIDGQRGESGGALAGEGVVNVLAQSLRDIIGYNGTGSVQSLAALGVTFDKNYTMVFDPSVLSDVASKDLKGVTDFLGNATTSGFLKNASDVLKGVLDSVTGVIPTSAASMAGEITDIGNRINDDQDRVDLLTQTLNAQMAAADALIAQMQQQAAYFANMFATMTSDKNAMS
jgi:flagellar hook-associated protein 2